MSIRNGLMSRCLPFRTLLATGLAVACAILTGCSESPDSQFANGRNYESGRGVEKDLAEAARWYQIAAGQGTAYAQFNLGVNR